MRILVVGGGGREHAIAWSLSRSRRPINLFIAPGNSGTASLGTNLAISVEDLPGILDFVRADEIELVIVGPEIPLVNGLADRLRAINVPVVGPSADAARLEGSKAFAKAFMARHGIPTASHRTFGSGQLDEALAFVSAEGAPIVVKASGLAAGKGAIVCATETEAIEAVTALLESGVLGQAGSEIVIENFLEGEEASLFALTDGTHYVLLSSAQDHKRIGEGDTGPNTGGMGAYAPAPVMTDELTSLVRTTIIEPTLEGMAAEGHPYSGVLYVGLMICADGPKVVEYNCRLGDPETQVVMPLLGSDAVDLFYRVANSELAGYDVSLLEGSAACVVMASSGYPGAYEKGKSITGIDAASASRDLVVFHAGVTGTDEASYATAGGRVLAVTALGNDLLEAVDRAYEGVRCIFFEGSYYRRDIGRKGLSRN